MEYNDESPRESLQGMHTISQLSNLFRFLTLFYNHASFFLWSPYGLTFIQGRWRQLMVILKTNLIWGSWIFMPEFHFGFRGVWLWPSTHILFVLSSTEVFSEQKLYSINIYWVKNIWFFKKSLFGCHSVSFPANGEMVGCGVATPPPDFGPGGWDSGGYLRSGPRPSASTGVGRGHSTGSYWNAQACFVSTCFWIAFDYDTIYTCGLPAGRWSHLWILAKDSVV